MTIQRLTAVGFETDPVSATIIVALFVLGSIAGLLGPIMLFRHIAQEERDDVRRQAVEHMRRFTAAIVLAVAFAVVLQAYPILDPCSEETLRRECGEWWEACWWAKGCFLPY